MTAPLDLSPSEEADALAAEYVLGVLSLQDRLLAEARIKSDRDFADKVAQWEAHFDALNDDYASVPAPNLMPHIEARIFGLQTAPKRNWWGFIAGAGVAAALAVAVILVLPPSGTNGPVLTAALSAEAQELAFKATYSDGELTLARLSGTDAKAGQDYELWLIVGDAAPVSLGLIKGAMTTRLLEDLAPGSVLAVSLEAAGGSVTGAPAEVLMVGKVTLT
jgi:anti-sigma-K factor RskA